MKYCYLIAIAFITFGLMLFWGADIHASLHIEIDSRKSNIEDDFNNIESKKSKNRTLIVSSVASIITGVMLLIIEYGFFS